MTSALQLRTMLAVERAKTAFATNAFSGPMNPNIQSGASYLPPGKVPSLRAPIEKSSAFKLEGDAVLEVGKDGKSLGKGDVLSHHPTKIASGAPARAGFSKESDIGTLRGKTAAGAPTRGGFMMASDIPPFRVPGLKAPLEKAGDMLPDYVTYNQGDFSPAKLVGKSKTSAGQNETIDENARGSSPEDFKKISGTSIEKRLERLYERRPDLKKLAGTSPFHAAQTAKTIGTPKITPPGPSIADIAKPKGAGFGTGIAGAFKPNTGIGGTGPVGFKSNPGAPR